ncbi:MAG TPA: beta-ketoacyl reductase, partial [Mycobacterium sp.]
DWWVGFSSMAALLGLPGQVPYATANAYLDALMAWRRASGLPGTAIDWGQWSDVGIGRSMTLSVLDPISPDEGVEALNWALGGDRAQVGVGRLRLDRAVVTIPEFRDLGYFENLIGELDSLDSPGGPDITAVTADSAAPHRDWSAMSAEERRSELQRELHAILARELRSAVSAVDVDQPFPELGLDSMMAMAMLKQTQRLVGMDLSASMFWNHPTVSALSAHLVELLAPRHAEQDDSAPTTADIMGESAGVLDELFESVESTSAGSESGI